MTEQIGERFNKQKTNDIYLHALSYLPNTMH